MGFRGSLLRNDFNKVWGVMAVIPLKQLVPGMVLEADVRDLSGRLLLKTGESVTPKHMNIFKTWGVPEVKVRDQAPPADALGESGSADQARLEAGRRRAEKLFRHADIAHPVMRELFRIAAERFAEREGEA